MYILGLNEGICHITDLFDLKVCFIEQTFRSY